MLALGTLAGAEEAGCEHDSALTSKLFLLSLVSSGF
jgi:hypothetical protein